MECLAMIVNLMLTAYLHLRNTLSYLLEMGRSSAQQNVTIWSNFVKKWASYLHTYVATLCGDTLWSLLGLATILINWTSQ